MNIIDDLLTLLKMHPTYKGYHFLKAALAIAMTDEVSLTHLTSHIYQPVAMQFHTTYSCVERNIRHLITVWWNTNAHKILYQLTPYPISQKPAVGELLGILQWILRKAEEQPELLKGNRTSKT